MIKSVLPLLYLGTFITFRLINWTDATLWLGVSTAIVWCIIAVKKLNFFQPQPHRIFILEDRNQ